MCISIYIYYYPKKIRGRKLKTMKKRCVLTAVVMAGSMFLNGCDKKDVKPVILAVSFGTSFDDNRELTIGAVEKAISSANSDFDTRRAFTSQIVIDVIKENKGEEIDNVEEAFDKLVKDGVKELVVQPTHVISGFEYDDLVTVVEKYEDKFDSISMGMPLLDTDEDYKKLADALVADTESYSDDDTAIVFMGHGTHHEANESYGKLQNVFLENGNENYFVGTVEGTPALEDVVKAVKDGGYKKVVLQPLMVVAGDHANNDMAGDEEDSWKTVFENEGFEVECILRGLGEIKAVQDIYVSHTANAVTALKK